MRLDITMVDALNRVVLPYIYKMLPNHDSEFKANLSFNFIFHPFPTGFYRAEIRGIGWPNDFN